MVLMIDEAKYLVEAGYYSSFRWVIDQVIEPSWLLNFEETAAPPRPLPFMAIFLGTNSKVADFLPLKEHSSARYFYSSMKVPGPFTALAWDIEVKDPNLTYETLKYSNLADMKWLARFGRPNWLALLAASLNNEFSSRYKDTDQIITLAMNKLHQMNLNGGFRELFTIPFAQISNKLSSEKEKYILTCSAILGVLAIIDLDFSSPKRAATLVASRLRWAVGCNKDRTFLLTAYPSEPVLAEAASRLLYMRIPEAEDPDIVLKTTLTVIATEVERGGYDVGGDGELVARILCECYHFRLTNNRAGLLARRRALETFYEYDMDCLGPCKDGSEPRLYSHLPTPGTVFLESLFQKQYIDQIKTYYTALWERLQTCYVNFSHFSEDISHKDAYNSLTVEGLLAHFIRGSAIKCRFNQAGIDMVIPMANVSSLDSPVSISDISAFIIQVKNIRDDKYSFTSEFIDKVQFDIRHIGGLSQRDTGPFYVGIWMSLRDTRNDVNLEKCSGSSCGIFTIYSLAHCISYRDVR